MRKPHGHASIVGGGVGQTTDPGLLSLDACMEADTFTCGHCTAIVHVPVRCDPADMGGLCKICMQLICPKCYGKNACTPWEKTFAEMEARQEALRSYGMFD